MFDPPRSALVEDRPWERHSGAGQVGAAGKPLQAALADPVLDHESEGRDLDQRRSVRVRVQAG